jgi:hypothetical protein
MSNLAFGSKKNCISALISIFALVAVELIGAPLSNAAALDINGITIY